MDAPGHAVPRNVAVHLLRTVFLLRHAPVPLVKPFQELPGPDIVQHDRLPYEVLTLPWLVQKTFGPNLIQTVGWILVPAEPLCNRARVKSHTSSDAE